MPLALQGLGQDELFQGLRRFRQRVTPSMQPSTPTYTLPNPESTELFEEPTPAAMDALRSFAAEMPEVLGLDTEWADSNAVVALVQLASESRVLLLRPAVMLKLPEEMRLLLAEPAVRKCGVGVLRDAALLQAQFGLLIRGAVDLSPLALREGFAQNGVGLASICQAALGKVLPKDSRIRCSQWDCPLSTAQIQYAACDAGVAVDIVLKMYETSQHLSFQEWTAEFVDQAPKLKNRVSPDTRLNSRSAAPGKGGVPHSVPKVPLRKSPLYGGCRMLGPDGTHLANVSRGKAHWYVQNGLADLISEEPFYTFKLLTEPGGLGHAGDDFYLQDMVNQCVGCGHDEGLVRFSIVPHCFRTHLPKRFKEHSSHDIVLLCLKCFKAASDAVSLRRHGLFVQNRVDDCTARKCIVDQRRERVRRAAKALSQSSLPPEARERKLQVLKDFFKKDSLTSADLDVAAQLETRERPLEYTAPEEELAEKLGLREEAFGHAEKCQEFVVAWRKAFLEAVRPQHLPAGWDANRPIDRGRS